MEKVFKTIDIFKYKIFCTKDFLLFERIII